VGSRVLVVEHEVGAPAAWLGEWLEAAGVELDVRRPYAGDALPRDLEEHDGLLVLGGGVDAWDDVAAPWLPDTRALVRLAEATHRPTLGLCLGHQVATMALGGEVGRNPAGTTIGVLPVGWGDEAADDPLLGALTGASAASHWNNDVALSLPPGARVLARSPDGAVQAARLGEFVWGLQCHPEAGPAVLQMWVDHDGAPHAERGIDLDAFMAAARARQDELRSSWQPLGEAFAALLVGVRR
jgi:GMP synthase (glutamine-hydrolysing)